ncbi:MAG: glycerol acyltransferase, partial [Spirochaetales bacterium]|nr:glycerol acyltransferase [Spirochaetales bacterium]
MDLSAYRDIAPYRGQDVLDAVERVKQNVDGIVEFLGSVSPVETAQQRAALKAKVGYILKALDEVRTYDDFQRKITAGVFLPQVVENSVDEFTFSGTESLDKETAYLFVSTHRDIVLDCALIDLALDAADQMLCEMAIG